MMPFCTNETWAAVNYPLKLESLLQPCLFVVCAIAVGVPNVTAAADAVHDNVTVRLEDMNCELVDITEIEVLNETVTRATGSINGEVSANKTAKDGSINMPMVVSQRGDYAVAIRNNSSNTVHVVGLVEY